MRYISLAMIALGALMFPFAAKRALLGLSDNANNDLRSALLLLIAGLTLIAAGALLAKRDELTSAWRTRSRPSRIRLR
jgi:uncharacterized protein YjeT (DUF2065 family)